MKFKIEDLILTNKCYAHKRNDKNQNIYETLEEHSELTNYYYNKLKIESIVKRSIKYLSNKEILLTKEEQDFIYDMVYYSIYFHDLGKINPCFQFEKMSRKEFKKYANLNSFHSIISAFLLYQIFKEEIEKNNFIHQDFIEFIMIRILFLVSRHHGDLKDFDEIKFTNSLKEIQNENNYFINYKGKIDIIIKRQHRVKNIESDENSINIYIFEKIVYSLMLTCDRYATDSFMNDEIFDINKIDTKINDFCDNFEKSSLYKGIMNYRNKGVSFSNPINNLRSDMFLEAKRNLSKNIDKNIFYLEMPVGSGKTNTSIGLATKLAKYDKSIKNIFYTLPFNSIAIQTYNNLIKLGDESYIHMFNSVTPIARENENFLSKLSQKDKDKYYHDMFQSYQFLEYNINVISHIKFFSTLFSCNLENCMVLHKYINSIIIIDEIQCYKNSIWRHIITMLNKYTKILNIKIIIMSATLPNLSKLTCDNIDNYATLITNPHKYYYHPLFKNRVKCDYSLLKKSWDEAKNNILEICKENEEKKIVIEFIKKKSANEFYEAHKKELTNCYLLTGDNDKISKQKIINEIKKDSPICVITTQVLEAGVDVSFDIGFKDSSILDSEEQFLGRINRNNEKQGFAYFFNKDDCKNIYSDDLRTNYSISDTEMQSILDNKNFDEYYELVLNQIMRKTSKSNKDNIDILYFYSANCSFLKIENLFKLIEKDDTISVIIDGECYDEETEEIYNSEKLMEDYKELIKNKKNYSYSEYMIKLSNINSKLSLFEKDIYKYKLKEDFLDIGYEKDENLSIGYFTYLRKNNIFI